MTDPTAPPAQRPRHPKRVALIVAVLIAAAVGGFFAERASSPSPGVPTLSATAISTATDLAKQYAVWASKPNTALNASGWPVTVTCAKAIAATRDVIVKETGAAIPKDPAHAIAVVQLCGEFSPPVSRPKGAALPAGTYLSLVLDPVTGTVFDYSLGRKPFSFHATGSTTNLLAVGERP